jgi:agmatinase
MPDFDPNGVGIANGNLFGFPTTEKQADIVITPVPWDATASYGKGTSDGPQAILEASTQLDFFHPYVTEAWKTNVFMSPISEEWKKINAELCVKAIDYIQFLENGGIVENDSHFQQILQEINEAQTALKINLKEKIKSILNSNKIPAILGGEHSTPLALIESLDELKQPFGILQIDAHADLRVAYEGFEQSHASIMYNVLKNCKNVEKIVQVGIRDISQTEIDFIKNNSDRISTFFDWDIKEQLFKGKTWHEVVNEIVNELPQNVYISFDIDGLRPYLCPNTGTPVAGGFELEEINYLFFELVKTGRKIIAFDLNEVSPNGIDDWDANVGARALWNIVCATELSRRKNEESCVRR